MGEGGGGKELGCKLKFEQFLGNCSFPLVLHLDAGALVAAAEEAAARRALAAAARLVVLVTLIFAV